MPWTPNLPMLSDLDLALFSLAHMHVDDAHGSVAYLSVGGDRLVGSYIVAADGVYVPMYIFHLDAVSRLAVSAAAYHAVTGLTRSAAVTLDAYRRCKGCLRGFMSDPTSTSTAAAYRNEFYDGIVYTSFARA